ncbi:MAG TPA: ATP-binding protein, partial [Planctomycetota bacterium]|nr:ATP-binding protein [Planctomycetota bacterium]
MARVVNTDEIAKQLAQRLGIREAEAKHMLSEMCSCLRDSLAAGRPVELGDLISLTIEGRPELREDESGGFSAYAPTRRALAAAAVGALKTELERATQAPILYVARGSGAFREVLADHFGRRGWKLVHAKDGHEATARLDRSPPAAVICECSAEGWSDLVRELKGNPHTNWIPIVGIRTQGAADDVVHRLTVLPDLIVEEPFEFTDFIRTAASEIAERVTAAQHDLRELHIEMPGTQTARREACDLIEEVLFRCGQPEEFCRAAKGALGEALDNAARHGHRHVECCTIELRMILDPRRLVLAVRDSGEGFNHAAALSAVRGIANRASQDPLARAAAALKSRRGDAKEGGLGRMLKLVDRVEFNRIGNEVVLTKFL